MVEPVVARAAAMPAETSRVAADEARELIAEGPLLVCPLAVAAYSHPSVALARCAYGMLKRHVDGGKSPREQRVTASGAGDRHRPPGR